MTKQEETIRLLDKFANDYLTNKRDQELFEHAIECVKERKVGHWIFGETMGHSWMKCSECCVSQDGQTLCFTYCPNCGAKMEAAKEGSEE